MNGIGHQQFIDRPSEDTETPFDVLMNTGVEDYFESRSYDGRDLGYFTPDNNPHQGFEQFVSKQGGFHDHLNWQLRFATASEDALNAAESVIGNIDDNGYLQATVEEIALSAGVSETDAYEAILVVQGFDPPGVGARDLRECLLIQIRQLGLHDSLAERMIRENLKEIERRKYQEIASQHGVPVDEVRMAVQVIQGLEPKPGAAMSGSDPIYIKPDVYVVREGDGFRIILNDEGIPHLRINGYYRKLMAQKNTLQKEEKEYLKDSFRSAVWLLKSLDHRNKTIYRVTESIIKFQGEFFEQGVSALKPQNLKDVARDLGMHESTISRATSNKYLSCQHGLFGFRYFFSSSLKSGEGTVSSTSVKTMIQKITEEENSRKPYSDQKISELLKSSGITVARRTVAKYREELRIPAQHMRRRAD